MKLKRLTLSELKTLYETELTCTFPREELKPYSAMEGQWHKGCYHAFQALDDGDLSFGYALLWSGTPNAYILLDYLGVIASRRNSGLGGAILGMLAKEFQGWQGILVEAEAEEGTPADTLRRSRLDFYRRNGCRLLPYDTWIFGVHYRTFLIPLDDGCCPEAAQRTHREIYHNYFTPAQVEKLVRVPLDLTRPLPVLDWDEVARSF